MRKRKRSKRKSHEEVLDELARKICWKLADYTCARCGRRPTRGCHHVFSRVYRSDGLRWDQRNLVNLCYACHIHWAEVRHEEFRDWYISRVGQRTWNAIKQMAYSGRKLTPTEMEALIDELKRKLERIGGEYDGDL